MSALAIVLLILALLFLLAVGGAIAQRRRLQATESGARAEIARADADLAAAFAADRGWSRARMEEVARTAFARDHPDLEIEQIELLRVLDQPGKDQDRATFRISAGGESYDIGLNRRGDDWVAS